ncbi:MAG: hypothetical protein KBG15_02710 [Kofleriaceae bacterium]|nr:hypothetical protein [Kofleriaceae bacterium]
MQNVVPTLLSSFALAAFAACGGGDSNTNVDATPMVDAPDAPPATTDVTLAINKLPADRSMLHFAVLDAAGTWTTAPAPVGNSITFKVQGPTFVLAIGCNTGFFVVTTDLVHRATSEQGAVDAPFLCDNTTVPASTKVSGTITSLAGSANTVAMGDDVASVNLAAAATTGPYELNVPAGTVDVFSARLDGNGLAVGVAVERNFVVGATPITGKDLALTAAVAPVVVVQPGAQISSASTAIFLSGTRSADLDIVDPPYSYVGLPISLAKSTDLYQMTATNDDPTGAGDVSVTTIALQPAAITFEANLMAPLTLSATEVAFTQLAAPGVTHSGFGFGQNVGGDFYIEFAQFSPGYLAAKSTWPVTDFSGLSSWPIELKAVTSKGRSFTITGAMATGTPATAGFRAVRHSNNVEIPATMMRQRLDGKLPAAVRALKNRFAQRMQAAAL